MANTNSAGTITVFGDPIEAAKKLTPPANLYYDAGHYFNIEYQKELNAWASHNVSASTLISDVNNGYKPFPAFADPKNPAQFNTSIVEWIANASEPNGGHLIIHDPKKFDAIINDAKTHGKAIGPYHIDKTTGIYTDI